MHAVDPASLLSGSPRVEKMLGEFFVWHAVQCTDLNCGYPTFTTPWPKATGLVPIQSKNAFLLHMLRI